MLKVCTWNINGIRSLSKPFKSHLDMLDADIICLQETKAGRVCIFCREPLRPVQAYDGLCAVFSDCENHKKINNDLDAEGRGVIVQFETDVHGRLLSIVSVYCPRVDPRNEERIKYKERFLDLLKLVITKLIANGSLAHPVRRKAFTCWDLRIGARKTNHGTRIDYIFYDKELASLLPICKSVADIMPEIEGSDHCPVWAILPLTLPINTNSPLPSSCSHFWPQCQKRQLLLLSFLKKDEETDAFSEVTVDGSDSPVANVHKCKKLKQARLDFSTRQEKSVTLEGEEVREMHLQLKQRDEGEHRIVVASAWRSLLDGSRRPLRVEGATPLCAYHGESCLRHQAKRKGSLRRDHEF
ncbi:DNA apurinic or apyrimidinic site endonuclease 2 [Taenia solium]|eukprot:TsM_000782000 transcript=TsM_000782000 gene=TsM_000782000